MNRKNFFKGAILALLSVAFISCSDDDDDNGPITPPGGGGNDSTNVVIKGAYILNAGKYNGNNSSISYFDIETEKVESKVFESANNGRILGDSGQDMLQVGNEFYVAVYGSAYILVTDENIAVTDTVVSEREGQFQQPRALAADNKYVYVTYYDGYVGRIDRNSKKLDEVQIFVGSYPEQLKIADDKIYVAVSGWGQENIVAVIDTESFEKIYDIEVVQNPTSLEVDGDGNIYVISMGNYGDIPNTLQRIDAGTKTSKVLGESTFMALNAEGTKIYTIYSQYTATGEQTVDYRTYDVKNGKFEEGPFLSASVTLSANPVCLSLNPETEEIYLGVTDYNTVNDVYIISPETGEVNYKFGAGGMAVTGIYFVQ